MSLSFENEMYSISFLDTQAASIITQEQATLFKQYKKNFPTIFYNRDYV